MSENIGIMDKAYFVGKREILQWINTTLQCNVEKVEDAHSGWVYCQIMDSIFPGAVPLHRVNFNARTEYEKLQNLKILQDVFAKNDIKRAVDINKLVKGKFQDNMEFCQWLKHFHGIKTSADLEYPAEERRNEAIAAYSSGHKHAPKSFQPAAAPAVPAAPKPAAAAPVAESKVASKVRATSAVPSHKPAASSAAASSELEAKVAEQTQKIAKLRLAVEGLEKERDFYFAKLREIEVLCQSDEAAVPEAAGFKDKVLEILYKTDDEEFAAPAEDTPADQ